MGRKKPDSYLALTKLINNIIQRAQGIPVANLPFAPASWTAFFTGATAWLANVGESQVADSVEQQATALARPAGNVLRMFCSHFLQILNFAIDRGEIPATVRPLYGIATESKALPPMDADEDVILVAGNIVAGEAARVAAGGTAFVDVSAAMVAAKLAIFNPLQQDQAEKMESFTKEQKDLFLAFPDTVKKTMRLFDELVFNNPDMTEAEIRSLCKGWGLPYTTNPGEVYEEEVEVPAEGFVQVDGIDLADTDQVTLTILQGGAIKVCRNSGTCADALSLTPDAPLQVKASEIPGGGANLGLLSGSDAATTVRVKVVG